MSLKTYFPLFLILCTSSTFASAYAPEDYCDGEKPTFVYQHTEWFAASPEDVFSVFYRPDAEVLVSEWKDLAAATYPSPNTRYFEFAFPGFRIATLNFLATDRIVKPGVHFQYEMSGDAIGVGNIEFTEAYGGTLAEVDWIICRLDNWVHNRFFRTMVGGYMLSRQNKGLMNRGYEAMRRIIEAQ